MKLITATAARILINNECGDSMCPQYPQLSDGNWVAAPSLNFLKAWHYNKWTKRTTTNYGGKSCGRISMEAVAYINHSCRDLLTIGNEDVTAGMFSARLKFRTKPLLTIPPSPHPHSNCVVILDDETCHYYEPQNKDFELLRIKDCTDFVDLFDVLL